LTLAERAEVELFGFKQDYWFAQLESERDNLRAALQWAVESGRAAIAVPLAAALCSFWTVGAQFAEGRVWSERVLAMPSSHELPKFRARLAVGASTFGFARGDMRTIEATLADVADLDNQLADAPHFEAGLLYTRAAMAQRRGDWAVARDVLERLESHTFAVAFPGFRAMCMQLLAETCLGAGDLEGAYRHASRALALADEVGFASASGLALYTLGTLEYRARDLASARQRFEASARAGQERSHGTRWWAIYALSSLSHVAIDQGDYPSGRAALLESVARWPELGNAAALARLLEASAHLAVATGRHVEALRLVGTAARLRESAGRPTSAAERVALEQWLRPAYDSLTEETASAAWQAGQAILPEDALRVVSASLAEGDAATVPTAPSAPRRRR
jgi:tetratricopeptide (TPR) repeat protein